MRIAVVGGGPVGLWVAVLLAQKYRPCKFDARHRKQMISWNPALRRNGTQRSPYSDGPIVSVFEARSEEDHCTRAGIRIALSSTTQALLNRFTRPHTFTSGMPLAEIESALLRSWRALHSSHHVLFDSRMNDPVALVEEGYDCVFWAGGRRSLDEAFREKLGCKLRIGESEQVLVFQLCELSGEDFLTLARDNLTALVRQATGCKTLQVVLRPGVTGVCAAWVWLFGLGSTIDRLKVSAASVWTATSMQECLQEVMQLEGPGVEVAHLVACTLQNRLAPSGCSLRIVDASFWSSDHAICELGAKGCGAKTIPIILVGDALCGRPFHTGTTLNRHFHEVESLVDGIDWTADGLPLSRKLLVAHERRYQAQLRLVQDFHRK